MPESGGLELKVISPDLEKVLKEIKATPKEIEDALSQIVQWGTKETLRAVKLMLTNRAVKVRTGAFRASITDKMLDRFTGVVWSAPDAFPGAYIREYGTAHLPGGALQPQRRRWMTIPLPAAQTASGQPTKATDYPDAWFYWTETGTLLLVQSTGDGTFIPLFQMRKRVTQKGERPFHKALELAEPRIQKHAMDKISKLFT